MFMVLYMILSIFSGCMLPFILYALISILFDVNIATQAFV